MHCLAAPCRPLQVIALSSLVVSLVLLGPGLAHADRGKQYALVVGVRDYVSGKFETLRYTENDAEDLAAVLRDSAGFHSVRVLTSTRGRRKASDAPTAASIRAAVKALLAGKGRHDTVLVALSGHGMQSKIKEGDREKDDNCFCPADAQLNDRTTLISLGQLVGDLDDCGAGVKLLLVDACRNDPTLGRNMDVETLPRLPRGTAALFSCKGGERAFETPKLGRGHGVFFHHVLEGLKGKAKNRKGEVTWNTLADYVTEAVSEDVPRLIGDGARQTPELKVNLTGKSPVLVRISEAEGLFRLARENHHGQGRRIDWMAAARLYQRAADAGHPLAGACLAICYEEGRGVTRDEGQARKRGLAAAAAVRAAAERGSAVAQDLLGMLYYYGLGVEKDFPEALRWFRKAADHGQAGAQTYLAFMYVNGWGVEKDCAEALRYQRKAAEQNHAQAQNDIGWMCQNGHGVAKSPAEALRWYRKAADQGYPLAQANLGGMYHVGQGVDRDFQVAARWYHEAAVQGFVTGQVNLGFLYEHGKGVDRNLSEARKWYSKAAAQGNEYARKRLKALQ
jgi:TPR repeat protein